MAKLIVNRLGEVFVDDVDLIGSATLKDIESVGGDHMVWFSREADRLLTPAHAATVKLVWKMQNKLETETDGTVAVAYYNDALRVFSEQLAFVDDTARLEALYAAAAKAGANVGINYDDAYLDHGWRPDGRGAMTEYFGPDHGRMERELDINIPIFEETEENVLAAVQKLTAALK